MKISKLFHWLYAILMLLPAFAIGVTCAYAIFNKNAYLSYEKTLDNKIVSLTSNKQIESNETYFFTPNNANGNRQVVYHLSNISITFPNPYTGYTTNNIAFQYAADGGRFIYYDNENNQVGAGSWGDFSTTFNATINSIYLIEQTNNLNVSLSVLDGIPNTIDNVFYYSIDKVQESPLFSWAYDSFLATPITYITRLFGMPDTNIAILLMSYWLDISIIYLVFDMIMYVPLLVHRWLDKGVLE